MVPVADGDENMEKGCIYEMELVKDDVEDTVSVVRPRLRTTKRVPNIMGVVKRAVASTNKDLFVDAALLDMTSMSFSMRERVYTTAQIKASRNKKVIVTLVVGRFQEWRQMVTDNMSYIAVDPNIDVNVLSSKAKRVRVIPYEFNTPFNTQVLSISKRGLTVLWAKSKLKHFIDKTMLNKVISMAGIPAVFSFSVLYHIAVKNRLLNEGMTLFRVQMQTNRDH